MKNILYLHAGAEMYGADKILLEVVLGLDKKKFHPIVVLPSQGVLVEKLRKSNIETYVLDYPILRRKYFNIRGMSKYLLEYRRKCNDIFRLFDGIKIDIIHVNTTAVLEGIVLKKKFNAKLLWHVHEIIVKPKIVHYFISLLLGRYADKVVVVSDAVRRHLLQTHLINKNKIQVIYNGVADNNIKNGEEYYLNSEFHTKNDQLKIGMIGRINAWKGQSDFIEALTPILRESHNVEAFLIGGVFEGEEWRISKLEEEISKTGVKDQFHLDGFRTDTDYLFKFFDIFVLPSNRPDPLPTVVLEAMAAGKPIVAYNHGGVTEMVVNNENGLLCQPNSPMCLTKEIQKLLDSRSEIKRMGENSSFRQKKYFSKKKFKKNFESIYHSMSSGVK